MASADTLNNERSSYPNPYSVHSLTTGKRQYELIETNPQVQAFLASLSPRMFAGTAHEGRQVLRSDYAIADDGECNDFLYGLHLFADGIQVVTEHRIHDVRAMEVHTVDSEPMVLCEPKDNAKLFLESNDNHAGSFALFDRESVLAIDQMMAADHKDAYSRSLARCN